MHREGGGGRESIALVLGVGEKFLGLCGGKWRGVQDQCVVGGG